MFGKYKAGMLSTHTSIFSNVEGTNPYCKQIIFVVNFFFSWRRDKDSIWTFITDMTRPYLQCSNQGRHIKFKDMKHVFPEFHLLLNGSFIFPKRTLIIPCGYTVQVYSAQQSLKPPYYVCSLLCKRKYYNFFR